jgi:phosphomevalonate kinase
VRGVEEKHRRLRRSGELSFVVATDSGQGSSTKFLVCHGSLTHSNPSQWEANPELPEEQKSLIDRFVQLRTVSEVRPTRLWRKVCETDLVPFSIQNIRANMRKMGEGSGVAIEPPQQTQLLDDCLAVTGVIAGGVPGGI